MLLMQKRIAGVKIHFSPDVQNAIEYSTLREVILNYSILELPDNLLYVSSLSKMCLFTTN